MPGEQANSCGSDFRQNCFAYTVNTQQPRTNYQKDFLQSVTTDFTPLSSDDTFLPLEADTSIPDTYIISVAEVTDSPSGIKTNKAAGPDKISNRILRDYATTLAPPVCAIFNSSLREGIVPQLWKCTDIRLLSKVQPPKLTHKDLRSISLTPVLSKCLEHFICAWITAIAGDQVDPQQFGSVKGTSTVHALIELVHRWKAALDSSGTMIRVLLVDFSKPFD
ncbi:hypothetical protein NP493_657g00006 [Ridgeia piscesae]|uniref:Reverse transcriptase domain-containing protein n=1 Tax=Ridgeia piscesae TaxID=27915 RepID=A0AAD9NNG9_RIDPI|nr:hypothetical protein NP493_657g00006 [Ridgeia piscesae]